MIKNLENQVEMEFGTGDIGLNSGAYLGNGNKVGVITFYNQEPREIGSAADIKAGTEVDINAFPVAMIFHKKESIDVIIKALLEAKNEME